MLYFDARSIAVGKFSSFEFEKEFIYFGIPK